MITAPGRKELALQAGGVAGILGAGLGMAATSFTLPLICPLRAMTGVPCPLCGMTTGTVGILQGDLAKALSSNPLSLAFVPGAVGFLTWKVAQLRGAKVRLPRVAPRVIGISAGLLLTASWMYQLFRFGFLG